MGSDLFTGLRIFASVSGKSIALATGFRFRILKFPPFPLCLLTLLTLLMGIAPSPSDLATSGTGGLTAQVDRRRPPWRDRGITGSWHFTSQTFAPNRSTAGRNEFLHAVEFPYAYLLTYFTLPYGNCPSQSEIFGGPIRSRLVTEKWKSRKTESLSTLRSLH